jgi:DNA-directed RNA polymerase subunit L
MNLPIIEIEWKHYKELDEIHLDDLTPFNILLLTLVKGDEVQLVAYDIEEKKWALLQQ